MELRYRWRCPENREALFHISKPPLPDTGLICDEFFIKK